MSFHFFLQQVQSTNIFSIMQQTASETGRLIHSSNHWNSIELPLKSSSSSAAAAYESIPSQFSKSVDCNLVITDKNHFHRFIFASLAIIFAIIAVSLLVHFLPQKHKHQGSSINLKLAINQALTFYDAQKCTISLHAFIFSSNYSTRRIL